MNYNEVLEEFPNFTSKNGYDLLATSEEFPTLTRANYSSVLKRAINNSNRNNMGHNSYNRNASNSNNSSDINNRRQKPSVSDRLNPENRNKFNKQYNEISYKDTVSAPITSNPHRTSEIERFQHNLQQQEQQHQQIYASQTQGTTNQLTPNNFTSQTQQSILNDHNDKSADEDMDL